MNYSLIRSKIEKVNNETDILFIQISSNADPNCPKMGPSERGVKEGGFENGGVGELQKQSFR